MRKQEELAQKKVLVTGGAGFIGSAFVRKFSSLFKHMYIVDSLTYAGNLMRIHGDISKTNVEFIESDILEVNNYQKIIKELDFVVHFAAESHVDRSIKDGFPFVNTNILGTFTLLENIRINENIKTLVVSTDEVYGSILQGEASESAFLDPSSAYSASKASADLLSLAQFKTHKQNILISRCSNNYGPYQDSEKFIPTVIRSLMRDEPVAIYGDGKNVREWIHVDDHCEALLIILIEGIAGEIYNIGSGSRFTNLEIVELISRLMGLEKYESKFIQDRKGHDFRYSLNSTKIKENFKWSPKVELEEGLKDLILNYEIYQRNMK